MLFVAKPNADQYAYPYYIALDCHVSISAYPEFLKQRCEKEKELIWMEWSNDMTAILTQQRYDAPVMVRVHDHEVYRGRVDNVNWNNVDMIWFINPETQKAFNDRIDCDCHQFFLPNAILPEQFNVGEKSKKIAFLSIFPRKRKRLDRAIDIIERINQKDPEWELHVMYDPSCNNEDMDDWSTMIKKSYANIIPHPRLYFEETAKFKEDVDSFFADKAYVLSTSEHEAFHYAIAEGMACGAAPLCMPWEWGDARHFWPTVGSSQIVDKVTNDPMPDPSENRKWVEERYSAYGLAELLKVMIHFSR